MFIGVFSNTQLLYRDSQQKLTIASFSFILTQIGLRAKKMKIHCWKLCFKTIIKQPQYFKYEGPLWTKYRIYLYQCYGT